MPLPECDKCGACCKFPIIEITENDIIKEPRLIVAEPFQYPPGMVLLDENDEVIQETILGYGGGALLACGPKRPCPMLGADNLCTIYVTRPGCCAAFEAGSYLCTESRLAHGLEPLPGAHLEPEEDNE
jgi:Fe-S-cluster containining protein